MCLKCVTYKIFWKFAMQAKTIAKMHNYFLDLKTSNLCLPQTAFERPMEE